MTPSPRGAFVSLPGGIGELVDTLAAAITPPTMTLSTRVTGIQHTGRFIVDTTAGRVPATAVILAVPAYAAGGMLRGVQTRLAALCEEVPYASTATVAFGYRRDQIDHPMRGSGFVVPRIEQSPLLAGTWVTSKWPGRAPDGHVLLRAFLGGGRDPHCLDRTDAELVDIARDALGEIMPIRGIPLFARLSRWTRQSPLVRGRTPPSGRRDRVSPRGDPRTVRHRQRLPIDWHSRLHRRRARDRCSCGGVRRHAGHEHELARSPVDLGLSSAWTARPSPACAPARTPTGRPARRSACPSDGSHARHPSRRE